MNSCQQQATIFYAVYLTIITLSLVSFYFWRRVKGQLRPVLFVVFVVCTLLVIDVLADAVVVSSTPMPSKAAQTCK